MDFLCGHERKFSDSEDPDMTDVLGSDIFSTSGMGVDDSFMTLPSLTDDNEHGDWFQSVFDEHSPVYNDRNLGEAASQPCIKSEHSYSVSQLGPTSPLAVNKHRETDTTMFQSSVKSENPDVRSSLSHSASPSPSPRVKYELPDNDPVLLAMTSTASSTTFTCPATFLLATTSAAGPALSGSGGTMLSGSTAGGIRIKTEPMDTYDALQEQDATVDTLIMPPTPPSSSDSDGSQSPHQSAPSSPLHQSPLRLYHYHPLDRTSCSAQTLSQPLLLSPVSQSGVLILSEEEKRTLIAEGYPIPSKLPLTKQEEKNLKKVRRKIKNKISAQESRRKKKEYVEALEKRMEAVNHENCDLKRQVETLESNHRSLLAQLHKLQALVAKVPHSTSHTSATTGNNSNVAAAAVSATQTGTVLM